MAVQRPAAFVQALADGLEVSGVAKRPAAAGSRIHCRAHSPMKSIPTGLDANPRPQAYCIGAAAGCRRDRNRSMMLEASFNGGWT